MENKEIPTLKRPADATEEDDIRKGKKKRGKVGGGGVRCMKLFPHSFLHVLSFLHTSLFISLNVLVIFGD